jgi:flagellar protein FliL
MAAAKPDAGAKDAKAEAPAAAPAAAPARRSGLAAWLPLIVALIAAPAATWATVEFVLLPRLQKKIAAPAADEASDGHKSEAGHAAEAHAAPASHGSKKAKAGKEGSKEGDASTPSYEFENVVVNLAGTMGTRYLKTTFLVTGADANIASVFTGNKARLTDVTLNVLSSLTLADLEEAGAKNLIREKLVNAYNQALGRKVAEQVYFSDFVIQ